MNTVLMLASTSANHPAILAMIHPTLVITTMEVMEVVILVILMILTTLVALVVQVVMVVAAAIGEEELFLPYTLECYVLRHHLLLLGLEKKLWSLHHFFWVDSHFALGEIYLKGSIGSCSSLFPSLFLQG